jgi:hypothetical protein
MQTSKMTPRHSSLLLLCRGVVTQFDNRRSMFIATAPIHDFFRDEKAEEEVHHISFVAHLKRILAFTLFR